jgi:hypothetical protein
MGLPLERQGFYERIGARDAGRPWEMGKSLHGSIEGIRDIRIRIG